MFLSRLMIPVALLSMALSIGCSLETWVERPRGLLDEPGGLGDATRGQDIVYNRSYTKVGLPLSVLRAVRETGPRPGPELDEPGRIPGRRGFNRLLPAGTVAELESNVVVVKVNCLTCHSGKVMGKTYVGVGNAFLNSAVDIKKGKLFDADWIKSLDLTEGEALEYGRWRDAFSGVLDYTLGTTVGLNTAIPATSYLFAHRDPETYEWREEALYPIDDWPILEVDVPPWWHFAKKNRLYYGGEAVGDSTRHIMQFMSTVGNTKEDLLAWEGNFRDIAAYLEQLEPPKWKGSLDERLLGQGRGLFESYCVSCHGTYGENESYPNKIVPIEKIGTDNARHVYNILVKGAERYNQTWHGQNGSYLEDTLGYIAPPLDGIWASAPYLHNGAVPTLWDLLSPPDKRPDIYLKVSSSDDYDRQKVGWHYERLQQAKADEVEPDRRVLIYDSQGYGMSNGGHKYGTTLSEEQRWALVEYMKSL